MCPLRVAVLVHSLNHNNIGRVYPFLRAWQADARVALHLIGLDDGSGRFPLLEDLDLPITALSPRLTLRQLVKGVDTLTADCDLLHVFKTRQMLPVGIAVARRRGLPLVLDVDDWEMGLYAEAVSRWRGWRAWQPAYRVVQRLRDYLAWENLATSSAITARVVNSTFLQARFGGHVIYTGVDCDQFSPVRADRNGARAWLEVPDETPLIGFLGTPHPYKGIDDLLLAVEHLRLEWPGARLLVAGLSSDNPYSPMLRRVPHVLALPYVRTSAYPDLYAACDVVAVPQRRSLESLMQTPAKLILAMAMARPIVATSVGDIPAVLGDTGVLIPPEDTTVLTDALRAVLRLASGQRAEMGQRARARCISQFSLEVLREEMWRVYRSAFSLPES
jgi:glycosyltransferase involved in cell wall biosynthesis